MANNYQNVFHFERLLPADGALAIGALDALIWGTLLVCVGRCAASSKCFGVGS